MVELVEDRIQKTEDGKEPVDKLRLVAVSYLNTKPLLYGLLRSDLTEELDMDLAIPSECARRLKDNEADLALVPVAIIPELPEAHIISDYCIGTDGAVATVCIYGDVPLHEMTTIYLDHHSRTSVMLARLLLAEYWQHDVKLLPAEEGYIDRIGGTIGGLVIGDRTIGLDQRFKHVYGIPGYRLCLPPGSVPGRWKRTLKRVSTMRWRKAWPTCRNCSFCCPPHIRISV